MEPSNQQEAYDMVYEGFQLSETLGVPIMVRIPTRLAHSRTGVVRNSEVEENILKMPVNPNQFVLIPAIARKRYKSLLQKQESFEQAALNSKYNLLKYGSDRSLGIIACGIAFNYLNEIYKEQECPYTVLKLSHYPIPSDLIREMGQNCDEVLVLEEGYPLVEEAIKGILKKRRFSHISFYINHILHF